MNIKHVLIMIMLTLLIVTAVDATSTNSTHTQSDTIDVKVTNTQQLTKAMESLEEDESTIKLEEGNYDSFNINWNRKDKELVIDGNNQKITGEVSINVAENSKLTIKSLTLNHTGLDIARIINNGTLNLNRVHLTNSHKINITGGYVYDSSTDEEQEHFQETRKQLITTKDNTSGIHITNNNRLNIINSVIDDNHVQSSIITNNYIASINNTTFTNNYADSLFDNNAKLHVNNTVIDKDNVNALVKVDNIYTDINPEMGIFNSQMSYNQLGNYIVDDNIYSKLFIVNSTFKKIITPYDLDIDDGLCLEKCGENILADNSVYSKSYIDGMNNIWGVNNTITFSGNNQTRTIWKNYDETRQYTYETIQDDLDEFQKYFTDKKQIPHIKAYYNTTTSSLRVNVTRNDGSNVDGTVIILIEDGEADTLEYMIRTNEALVFNDSTVNDASEIYIIFEEDEEYYQSIKTYILEPVAWDYQLDEEYWDVLPGLELSEMDMYDLDEAYKPGDDIHIFFDFYGVDGIKNYELGKIYFSFDNDTISLNLTPENEMEFTYHIPEDMEFGEYPVNATFIHPEYFTSRVTYYVTITNDTEEYFDEDEEYPDDEEYLDDENYLDEDEYPDEDEEYYSDDESLDEGEYSDDDLEYEEYSDEEYDNLMENDTVTPEISSYDLSVDNYDYKDMKQLNANKNISIGVNNDNRIAEANHIKSISKTEHTQAWHSNNKNNHGTITKNSIFKKGAHITLAILNGIFGIDFSNHLIQVYLDAKLVYNGTCTDNLLEVIFELTGDSNATNTIKVVADDNVYTQNITVL